MPIPISRRMARLRPLLVKKPFQARNTPGGLPKLADSFLPPATAGIDFEGILIFMVNYK